ncbi:hypothetical protein FM105_11890 [Brevibacterium yomogidense]|uniref:Uncharacterized protein n=1 Tax=Brevibacterium yomogidense TaxID=946573 RepID=A0A1X6XLM5_9MICO|nr:hypothetical protein FM105_11890 [Brevibacterium yomogidense]
MPAIWPSSVTTNGAKTEFNEPGYDQEMGLVGRKVYVTRSAAHPTVVLFCATGCPGIRVH